MHNAVIQRPNILFILSDDQGSWALCCAGNREIDTPNLDRLAAAGLRFTNFFCASPVCSPARATLLTGRIPSQHGVHDWIAAGDTIAKYEPVKNGELIEYLKDVPGYTDLLAKAGYCCGLSGKWHLGDCHHAQKGFEFWEVHAKGGGPYYHAPMIRNGVIYEEPRYITDAITENALRWLEKQKGKTQPFYLGVHYTAPHIPWERKHHPVELYDRYYNDCDFHSVPDNLIPPAWVKHRNIPVDDPDKRRGYLSGYYAAITAMDQNIGRILDYLEANGLRENTLVVFSSDNGMNMGHHGVFGKGNATFPLNMFDESVKVPFLVSQPGRISQGAVNAELISQYDFMPTLLEYVGIKYQAGSLLPGRSVCRALCGKPAAEHDHIVVFDEYGPVRMVRTKTCKYVHRYPYGPHELYDLKNDPGEQLNLVGDVAWRAIEKEMRQRLLEWFLRYVEPGQDGIREGITGTGQIGLCGRYSKGEEIAKLRIEQLLARKV